MAAKYSFEGWVQLSSAERLNVWRPKSTAVCGGTSPSRMDAGTSIVVVTFSVEVRPGLKLHATVCALGIRPRSRGGGIVAIP
jgi:hypothetical protein